VLHRAFRIAQIQKDVADVVERDGRIRAVADLTANSE